MDYRKRIELEARMYREYEKGNIAKGDKLMKKIVEMDAENLKRRLAK